MGDERERPPSPIPGTAGGGPPRRRLRPWFVVIAILAVIGWIGVRLGPVLWIEAHGEIAPAEITGRSTSDGEIAAARGFFVTYSFVAGGERRGGKAEVDEEAFAEFVASGREARVAYLPDDPSASVLVDPPFPKRTYYLLLGALAFLAIALPLIRRFRG